MQRAIELKNGAVDCWEYFLSETDAPNGEFTAITVGEHYSCGLRLNETIDCWGILQNKVFGYHFGPE